MTSESGARYIAVEGPIGVGKTALARRLATKFGSELILEGVDDNQFLAKFYEDPARYALHAQLFFLLERYRQQQALDHRALSVSGAVADYLFAKDRTPSASARSSSSAAVRAGRPCGAPSSPSTPSHAPTSWSWTRSASVATLYQLGTVVFVGGSLVPTGGHNVLEPAVYGKPIVVGPHMDNFREIADAFVAAGAAVRLDDESQLERAFIELLGDPVRRARLGAAARALVEANRGAKDKTMAALETLMPVSARSNVVPFRPIA